jgi:hypothetical protein
MPMAGQPTEGIRPFLCPVTRHRGSCVLPSVVARPSTNGADAIGSAVVPHGTFSNATLAAARTCHPGRLVTLDEDVLVVWPLGTRADHATPGSDRATSRHTEES